jgi:Flp pilus assembly protein TadD
MKRLAVLLSISLLAGCASVQPLPEPPPPVFSDASFAPPSEPVRTDTLFELSPEMQAYLGSSRFAALLRERGERHGLLDALYRKSDLQLEYESSKTRTAAETYAARSGNCLSLVIMTAAFAKALGMPVQFQNIDAQNTWSREAGLFLASSHVNILLGERRLPNVHSPSADMQLLVDFIPSDAAARLRAHAIEEQDIIALYANNRAAEMLVQDRIDDAYWWARAAVQARPKLVTVLNTLGVIYERHGDLAMAEATFRSALAREPENVLVMRNLHPVLLDLGKRDEALALAKRINSIEPVPPYYYFDQGMLALKDGEPGKAKSLFEREIKRAPFNDEFRFWLGIAYARMGDIGDAREQLALAVEHSTRRDVREQYSAKLAYLRQISMDARRNAEQSRYH